MDGQGVELKDDWSILYKEYVNFDNIIRSFNENNGATIYVLNQKQKLEGIITLGAWMRNIDDSSKWINTHPMSIRDNLDTAAEQAEKIISEYKNVNEIPVLDDGNTI